MQAVHPVSITLGKGNNTGNGEAAVRLASLPSISATRQPRAQVLAQQPAHAELHYQAVGAPPVPAQSPDSLLRASAAMKMQMQLEMAQQLSPRGANINSKGDGGRAAPSESRQWRGAGELASVVCFVSCSCVAQCFSTFIFIYFLIFFPEE